MTNENYSSLSIAELRNRARSLGYRLYKHKNGTWDTVLNHAGRTIRGIEFWPTQRLALEDALTMHADTMTLFKD